MESRKVFCILISLIISICFLHSGNVLAQKGRFKGKVTDEKENSIKAVIVLAENPLSVGGRIEVKTDKNGEFIFPVPYTGMWKLTITAEGYNYFVAEVHLSSVNKNAEKCFVLNKLGTHEIPQGSAKNIELFNSACELYNSSKYNEALELFRHFHEKNPNIYMVNCNIGMCLKKLGEYDKAVESYQKVLERSPTDYRTTFQIGQCYIELGKIEKALKYFDDTIQASSNNPDTYYKVAEECFYSINFEKSIHYYKKALERNPDFVDCYLKLGYTYLKLNDKAYALANLQKYLELNPQSEQKELIINVINQLIEELSKQKPQQGNGK